MTSGTVEYIIVLSADTDFMAMPPTVRVVYNLSMVETPTGVDCYGEVWCLATGQVPPADQWLKFNGVSICSWPWEMRYVARSRLHLLLQRALTLHEPNEGAT